MAIDSAARDALAPEARSEDFSEEEIPRESGSSGAVDGWVRIDELRPLLMAMNSLRDGDFTVRVEDAQGVAAELAGVFNQIVARNAHLAAEFQRVRAEIVRRGRLDERITASPGQGAWTTNVDAANTLLDALVVPV